jgi:hypothetical protein
VIALRNSLPLLRQAGDLTTPIRVDWLCFCLRRAADRAGYDQWWLAEHVAQSVLSYLATSYDRNIIAIDQLTELFRSALQAIGYGEVALRFEPLHQPFELSLTDLASEAGPGYELAFFRLLKERMQPALSDCASNVHIYGLQSCVRHLQSVKTWSRSCSQLRNEIVDFVRLQMAHANLKSEILLTIR